MQEQSYQDWRKEVSTVKYSAFNRQIIAQVNRSWISLCKTDLSAIKTPQSKVDWTSEIKKSSLFSGFTRIKLQVETRKNKPNVRHRPDTWHRQWEDLKSLFPLNIKKFLTLETCCFAEQQVWVLNEHINRRRDGRILRLGCLGDSPARKTWCPCWRRFQWGGGWRVEEQQGSKSFHAVGLKSDRKWVSQAHEQ